MSTATHAGLQIVRLAKALPIIAAILAALVGMDRYRLCRFAPPDRHQQSVQCQCPCQGWLHRPTNDLASIKVNHHSQIQPALPGTDIRNIGHPSLVGSTDGELAIEPVRPENGRSARDGSRGLIAPDGLHFIEAHEPLNTGFCRMFFRLHAGRQIPVGHHRHHHGQRRSCE
jgi:hypothetical protein